MKRIILSLAVFLFAAAALGQVGIPPGVVFGNPTPGGACSAGAGQLVTSTGVIYTCVSSVWTATGTASFPGVTSNGANGLKIAGGLYTNTEFSNGTCTTAKTIDPANGNRQSMTLTAGSICVLTFTQPASSTASIQLRVIQAAGATGDIAGGAYPGMVHTTVTQTAGAIDFFSCYLDGTNTYCLPTQNYGIPLTAIPTFSPLGGAYSNDQSVTITDSQAGAVMSYCTDSPGSCTPATPYTVPVSVGATGTHLRSTGTAPGFAASSVFDQTYTFQVALPAASPAPGFYSSPQTVTLSTATSGAALVYCTDSNNSCTPGTSYSTPISVSTGNYLRISGTKSNYTTSTTFAGFYSNKGITSTCAGSSSTAVTSAVCFTTVTVTAGDIMIYTINTGTNSGLCPAGNTGDLTGLPAGSTVTVKNHCTASGIASRFISLYQVVIGTGGTYTPAITVPSQTFPLLTVDGFTNLSTGMVGSMTIQTTASAGTTVNGPSITPGATNEVLYGAYWNQNLAASSVACTGGVTACTFTNGNVAGVAGAYGTYNGPVAATTPSQVAVTTSGAQTNALVTGMVLQ